MNLHKKTLIFIGIIFVILLIVLITTSRFFVMGSFAIVEKRFVQNDMAQVISEISDEINNLHAVNYDWANWNETYDFIHTRNPEFVNVNLIDATLVNMRANIFVLLDTTGNVVYAKLVNLNNVQEVTFSKNLLNSILSYKALLNPEFNEKAGVILTPDDPMIISARSIMRSDLKGPPAGTCMIGRFLNDQQVKELLKTERINLSIRELDNVDSEKNPEISIDLFSTGSEVIVKPEDNETVIGYTLIRDIEDRPILILQGEFRRYIFQIGIRTLRYYTFWLLGISIVVALLVAFFLEKAILSRMSVLSEKVGQMGKRGNFETRLPVSGKDELSRLAVTINGMIEDLADFQKQKSEKLFRELVESSLVGICIIQDYKIVYMNPEQEKIWGDVPEHFDLFDLDLYPADKDTFEEKYRQVINRDVARIDLEVRFYLFDQSSNTKTIKWVHFRAADIEFHTGRAILINMVEITHFKNLEHMMQIREKMASLGRVAAGMAHEIRNPLSGITIILDAIKESFEDPKNSDEIHDLLTQSTRSAEKIAGVISRVLDFSKPGKPKFEMGRINPAIKDAIGLSRTSLKKSDILLESFLDENLPEAYIDIQMIEQVIINLINNAAEAMKNNTGEKRIVIISSLKNEHILIRVSDNGCGVIPEIRESIFDPFYTSRVDGSGIGLSICQRIVNDHGGTITVDSPEYGGAEFSILIPLDKRTFSE
ncbi:MAG: HAMP domain-containing protein [Desulfobacterales bacterium]|nr:HAMP domain-containing protein [Desulfobacterales bacterium]